MGNFAAANAGVYPGQVAQNFRSVMGVKASIFTARGNVTARLIFPLLLEKIGDDIESQTGFQPKRW